MSKYLYLLERFWICLYTVVFIASGGKDLFDCVIFKKKNDF